MKAEEFYEAFDRAFKSNSLPEGMKRLAGTISKWTIPLEEGKLRLKFATNSRAAGLFPYWPGEFDLEITWVTGKGSSRLEQEVSLFQYATEQEKSSYTELQNSVLSKYVRQRPPDAPTGLSEYEGPPRPNFIHWCYYTDRDDAQAWASWYGGLMSEWVNRFKAAPESRDQWCNRVLRPN